MSAVCPPSILNSSPVNLINVLKSTKTSFPERGRPLKFFEIKSLQITFPVLINVETKTKSKTCDNL